MIADIFVVLNFAFFIGLIWYLWRGKGRAYLIDMQNDDKKILRNLEVKTEHMKTLYQEAHNNLLTKEALFYHVEQQAMRWKRSLDQECTELKQEWQLEAQELERERFLHEKMMCEKSAQKDMIRAINRNTREKLIATYADETTAHIYTKNALDALERL